MKSTFQTGLIATGTLFLLALQPLGAQPLPIGEEFQVSEITTSDQWVSRIAVRQDGAFVIVWSDLDGTSEVRGRRFSAAGEPLGVEFQVNSYTTGVQYLPSVAMDEQGRFVVVWESAGSPLSESRSVLGQRFGADASLHGSEFQVSTYTSSSQTYPAVVATPDGTFVVAWSSFGSYETDSSLTSVQGQRYLSDGAPIGEQFQVNSFTSDSQSVPSLAMDADGGFVITWMSYGSAATDDSEFSVQVRRFASSGAPVGDDFQVNTGTTYRQVFPSVGMAPDGRFVIVWSSEVSSGDDSDEESIQGQRFAADGVPIGTEFQINTYTTGEQWDPWVAMADDGAFIVAWVSFGSPGTDQSRRSIQGRWYSDLGEPVGDQFQVNEYTTEGQYHPTVALDGDRHFVVTWTSYGSSTSEPETLSIQARRYRMATIFRDGFESGDTTLWSSGTQ